MDVALYLYGEKLYPPRVTEVMKVLPTKSWSKGEKVVGKNSGTVVVAKTGLWILKTNSASDDICVHLDELLNVLEIANIENIHQILGVQLAKVDIFILGESSSKITLSINDARLSKLASQKLRMDITLGRLEV